MGTRNHYCVARCGRSVGPGRPGRKCPECRARLPGEVIVVEVPAEPPSGAEVLHCGHINAVAVAFKRIPDGMRYVIGARSGVLFWVGVCQRCFRAAGNDFRRVGYESLGVWRGTPPSVPEFTPQVLIDPPLDVPTAVGN